MDLMLLRMFQNQVSLQCKYIISAAKELNTASEQKDIDGVFYAIQNLLNAAANISKALWGERGRLSEQRKPIRDSIGLEDDSPLKQTRMRNNFEHFDHRLDKWWDTSQHHNFMDLNIGPITSVTGIDNIDMFRLFDPATTDVIFWGQRFNLQEIVNEVRRILPLVMQEASKPHWERL